MTVMNKSLYRVENVDVNTVDADTLFAIAENYGFPALPISYPDYSKHMEIGNSRVAWERAVRYLGYDKPWGTDMYKYAFLKMWDWFAGPRNYEIRTPIIVSRIFNDRTYSVLNNANRVFSRTTNLNPCQYYRVCSMLTRAEKLNFPEIWIPWHRYTIQADMESWVKAAMWFYSDKAIVWITNRLIEWLESGNPPARIECAHRCDELEILRGSNKYVLIENVGGLRVWKQKQPIG
jgi:hypothetical protein